MSKNDKQGAQAPKQLIEDDIFDTDVVASSTECTGLIQTPPVDEAEAESYTDIYAIPKPNSNEHQ